MLFFSFRILFFQGLKDKGLRRHKAMVVLHWLVCVHTGQLLPAPAGGTCPHSKDTVLKKASRKEQT